jgi:hypothetical protein
MPVFLSLWVQDDMFELWLEEHSNFIGTTYVADEKQAFMFTKRPKHGAKASRSFRCSCKGFSQLVPSELEGGASGKKRNRQPSKKKGCTASLTAYFRAIVPHSNPVKWQTLIRYEYSHNHDLNSEDYLCQQRVSKNMKQRIKIMLLRGMSIHMILQRLGMDARRCRQFAMSVKGKRPSRDDFITYSDVDNILRTMMNKEIRRDEWDNVSAFKWMKELESKEFFAYYDEETLPNYRKDGTVDSVTC